MSDFQSKRITERVTQENIEFIKKIEEGLKHHRSFSEFLADHIGGAASNIAFVVFNLLGITLWILVNTHYFSGITPFDPYPFGLLALIITTESVLLFVFVLIKQNRMTHRAEQRSHLDLQLTMLIEQELTKVLQILERSPEITPHAEIDPRAKELSEETHLETLAKKVDEAFPEK
mgnify:FL=1